MFFVTRYRIEMNSKALGEDGFVDVDDAFEYRSEEEAIEDAEEFGGEVVKFQRYSKINY